MKTLIIACSFILFSMSEVAAQTAPITELPYIEMTGNAKIELVPDEIYIAIQILERNEGKTEISVEQQEADLKRELAEAGINIVNLSLAGSSTNYVKIRWSRKDAVTNKEYRLKVTTAEEAGKVFELLDELKIKNAYISHVDHSEKIAYKKKMRIQAIKAAKEKVEYLLAAIDEKVGQPMEIREQNFNALGHYQVSNRMASSAVPLPTSPKISDKALEFKKITIESTIYVKFAIQ